MSLYSLGCRTCSSWDLHWQWRAYLLMNQRAEQQLKPHLVIYRSSSFSTGIWKTVWDLNFHIVMAKPISALIMKSLKKNIQAAKMNKNRRNSRSWCCFSTALENITISYRKIWGFIPLVHTAYHTAKVWELYNKMAPSRGGAAQKTLILNTSLTYRNHYCFIHRPI